MGWLDFLKRDPSPLELRDRLIEAVAAGDKEQFEGLVKANEELIFEDFKEWKKVPLEVQEDPAAMQAYANALVSIAGYFAKALERPELLEMLVGGKELQAWQEKLREAQELKSGLRFSEAITRLSDALIDARGLEGEGVAFYRARSLGLLGDLHFQEGRREEAVSATREAMEVCEAEGDLQGLETYLRNLYELHRYHDQRDEAVACAERLAELGSPHAGWYRSQAKIVAAGEPLNRVVSEVDGVRAELAETGVTDKVSLVFQRNRLRLFASVAETERGEDRARAGELDEALAAFEAAAKADPYDPQPRYQAALTFLYMERYFKALARYEQVEELAPGWFHVRAMIRLAEEVTRGALTREALLVILQNLDGPADPTATLPLLEAAAEHAPQIPLLQLILAETHRALGQAERGLAAIERGLEFEPDADVRTRLLLNKALLGEDGERRGLLKEAVALNGNLVAAAMARLILTREAEDGGDD